MNINRQSIDIFLSGKNLAVAGVSRNPRKFGNIIFRTLKEKGYSVIPINPHGGKIGESICLGSVNELGSDVPNLLIVTHKRDTKRVFEEAIHKGIKNIWIQNGCESDEALNLAQGKDINLVSKTCFLMYANPSGFHKVHQTIWKWVGKYIRAQDTSQ